MTEEQIPCVNCITWAVCKTRYLSSSMWIIDLARDCAMLDRYIQPDQSYDQSRVKQVSDMLWEET